MAETFRAAILTRLLREVGAKPYPVERGNADTSKVARFLLPNGNPIVIGINNKNPTVWLLPQHERNAFRFVGTAMYYAADKSRSHHLQQVREFTDQPIVKVTVTSERLDDIRAAINAVAGAA